MRLRVFFGLILLKALVLAAAPAAAAPGDLKWALTTGGPVMSSPAVGADGTIYVGSEDEHLYALNPDGSLKWACNLGGFRNFIISSPAVGPDGTIYFGAYDHKLYAVYSGSPGLASSAWPMFRHDLLHTGRWPEWLNHASAPSISCWESKDAD
ncbi:MAG: PQQ-binding-like beta-propeller repeat protein [Thermodesulfobacteriota bacterium]